MRVLVNTPAELVAGHRPRLLPLLLFLLVAAVLVRAIRDYPSLSVADLVGLVLGVTTGAIIFVLVCRGSEFRFDAARGELRWRRRGLFSRSHGTVPLEMITGVTIETDRHGEGRPRRVALLTGQGRLPLTRHYSGIEPHDETKQAITLWLRDHGTRPSSGSR